MAEKKQFPVCMGLTEKRPDTLNSLKKKEFYI